jgi:hypothetical protein
MKRVSGLLLTVGLGTMTGSLGCGSSGDALPDAGAGAGDAAFTADARGGDSDATSAHCLDEVELRCPPSAPVLGVAGSYHVNTYPLQWEPCEGEAGVSVAPVVYVSIPSDLASMSITVEHGAAATGFGILAVDERPVIGPDQWGECPFKHVPLQFPASSVVFPMSPDSDINGPGCMAIVPVADGNLGGEVGTLHIVSNRGQPGGLLSLNVIIDEDASINADIGSGELGAVMDEVAEILFAPPAALVDDVEVYTTSGYGFIEVYGADFFELLSTELGDDPRRINVFFIEDFLPAEGILGIAGGIPGPLGVHGTAASGVVVAVGPHRFADGSLDVQFTADTIAHELGHQLGWFHTSESDGTEHDCLSDTPQCTVANDTNRDGEVSADECLEQDGTYLMFWAGDPDTAAQVISDQQAGVVYVSPVME